MASIVPRMENWYEFSQRWILALTTGQSFGELSSLITAEAYSQGLIREPTITEDIDAEKANSLSAHAAILWGTNAVTKSSRSQAQLGWTPTAPELSSEIAGIVKSEAESL